MKAPYILLAAYVLLVQSGSALAAPLPGASLAGPRDVAPGIMLVQIAQPDTLLRDRMMRLRQHRTLLESALQPPGPAEPLEPQVRALQVPVR